MATPKEDADEESEYEEEFQLPVVQSDGEPEVSTDEEEEDPIMKKKVQEEKNLLDTQKIPSDPDLAIMYHDIADKDVQSASEEEEEDGLESGDMDEEDLPSEDTVSEEDLDEEDLKELEARRKESQDEKDGSDFMSSLDDVKTDNEIESEEEKLKALYDDDKPYWEVWKYSPPLTDKEAEKQKKRRKLPKDTDDSDLSEYETILSGDEEHLKDRIEDEVELKRLDLAEIDKFEWHEVMEGIEEFDNNFDLHFAMKLQTSDESSIYGDILPSDSENNVPDSLKFELNSTKTHKAKGRKSKQYNRRKSKKLVPVITDKRADVISETWNDPLIKQLVRPNETLVYDILELNKYINVRYPDIEKESKDYKKKEIKNNNEINNIAKNSRSKGNKQKRHRFTRKKRNNMYKRLHDWYNSGDESDCNPDEDIPSFKAKSTCEKIRDNTVKFAIEKVLEQSYIVINEIEKAIERKEMGDHIEVMLKKLCNDMIHDFDKKKQEDAVSYSLEVILDKWEFDIYRKTKNIIDIKLDEVSEDIVTSAINNSISDLVTEDHISARLVRDALAESLDFFAQPRAKINEKLFNMFYVYKLPEHVYEHTINVKGKEYRSRRAYDKLLEKRQHKLAKIRDDKQREYVTNRRRNKLIKIVREILFKLIDSVCVENVLTLKNSPIVFESVFEESDNDIGQCNNDEKIDLGDDKNDEENNKPISQDIPLKLDVKSHKEKLFRATMRIKILSLWKSTHTENLHAAKKRQEMNAVLENIIAISDEEEVIKDKEFDDNNGDHDDDDDDDDGDNDDAVKLTLPILEEQFKIAIKTQSIPSKFELVTVKDKLENEEERNDSALGSELMKSADRERDLESGISSFHDDEYRKVSEKYDSYDMDPLMFEKEHSIDEIIELIPKIDREQYLKQWLIHGVTRPEPSPPPKSSMRRFVRKFTHKRPISAQSDASVFDIAPIDPILYQQLNGRLNSAKSTRSDIESAYSVCSSSVSTISENENIDSDNEQNKFNNEKNTKIEFFKFEKTEVEEEKDGTAAWEFYLEKRREKGNNRRKKKSIKKSLTEERMKLLNEEKEEILKNLSKTVLGDLPHEKEEFQQIQALSSKEAEEESDNELDREVAGTPWKFIENRPFTPDSMDSEEEVRKLKEERFEDFQKKTKKRKDDKRIWKMHIEQKKTSHIPQSAWQKPPAKDQHQNSLISNRELFLRLKIGAKNSQPRQHPILTKRASIGDSQGISQTKSDRRKVIDPEDDGRVPIRARSSFNTPALPPVQRKNSVITSFQGANKTQEKTGKKGFKEKHKNKKTIPKKK